MAKTKKKATSDVKLNRSQKKKQNPFEVHTNREKFKVLGKKTTFDKGLPGVARSKALKRRKETLLQEYKLKDKSNKFIDKRIGERNKSMTGEDRIIARFTAERMKSHKRKALFNLADEEVLTHKGRSITEVERFDDPRSDDDDDEGQTGNLNANFVEEAHFGGGMFTKSKNNRESVIDQLIAESKKRKFEKQQIKEKTLELTEKLDTEWRDLVPLISSGNKNEDENEPSGRARKDPYDIALRELKFEARGMPSDKLKSEEEIAEEEAKRLGMLEEERLRRMRGDDTVVTISKRQHKSADALEDNFQLDNDQEFSLMYDKDGNMIPHKTSDNSYVDDEEINIIKPIPDRYDESESDEEEDDSDDEDEEEDDDEMIQDLKTEIEACNEKEDVDTDDESLDESNAKETKGSDKLKKDLNNKNDEIKRKKITSVSNIDSDKLDTVKNKKEIKEIENEDEPAKDEYLESLLLKYSISENTDENLIKPPNMLILTTLPKKRKTSKTIENTEDSLIKKSPQEAEKYQKKIKKVNFDEEIEEVKFGENSSFKASRTVEEIRDDLMRRKELMDKARTELPYTYEVPKAYEELEEYFKDRNDNEITVIVERIIKCNHPSLREENKLKMVNLFAFLMQYLNDLDNEKLWIMLDRLIPYLYDLTMFSPSNVVDCIVEILKEKQTDYNEKKHKYPACSTLIFLKLIPLLFPPSDKRHPVTTPALVFMTQMLQQCQVNNRRSIATGLFVVSLIYEYVYLSKRICPQAINFLVGLLHLASPANIQPHIAPPFKVEHRFLYLQRKFSGEPNDWKMTPGEFTVKTLKIDDHFRVKSLYLALSLINLYLDLYSSHTASSLLFAPVRNYMASLEMNKYPTTLQDLVKQLNVKLIEVFSEKLEKLMIASKKPKVLRLFEPAIEPVYDTKKKKSESAEKAEMDKLLHKIKREKKGALREIRRDRAFMAKIKFNQQQKSDVERMKKVKQIYSWGAQQQGEINSFNRLKKKKH